ncbi:MAG: hypothetical protein ABSH08_22240, partial [Tepidisphaeraceae bacterium]
MNVVEVVLLAWIAIAVLGILAASLRIARLLAAELAKPPEPSPVAVTPIQQSPTVVAPPAGARIGRVYRRCDDESWLPQEHVREATPAWHR